MTMLLASLAALALGPLVYRLLQTRDGLRSFMEGFIFMAIGGIVVIGVFSEAVLQFNAWMAVFFCIGLIIPFAIERLFERAAGRADRLIVVVGVLGIVLHTIADGVALFSESLPGSENLLATGILLHRFPVSLTVWWLLKPRWNSTVASLVLGLMAVGTVAGYVFGQGILPEFSSDALPLFEAFVAGSILHVVFHRPHLDEGTVKPSSRWLRAEGSGNILGLTFVVLMMVFHPEGGHDEGTEVVWSAFLSLALESAPALLLAYFIGGIMGAFPPTGPIRWMQRGGSFNQAVKGVTVGLPLPICTCGVIPLYESLVQRGAPLSAALAFLIATPELGIDAVLLSIPLLGPEMTLVRVAAAFVVAVGVAWWVNSRVKNTAAAAIETPEMVEKGSNVSRIKDGLRKGFIELVDDTAPWILLGLLVAALFYPFFDSTDWSAIPLGLDVLVFALLGLPMYVCASGSTPIVAMLLVSGVSPGAGLAFLLTGPATNAATFGMLKSLHGSRVAWLFGVATMVSAVTLGIAVNLVWPAIPLLSDSLFSAESPTILQMISLAMLSLVYLASLYRRGAFNYLKEITSLQSSRQGKTPGHSHDHSHSHAHSHGDGHSH